MKTPSAVRAYYNTPLRLMEFILYFCRTMGEDKNKQLNDIEMLFKKHYPKLCIVANKIINDTSASEDIVQRVFEKLWQKKDDIQINSTHEGYLVRATSNEALNYLKKRKKIVYSEDISIRLKASEQDEKTPGEYDVLKDKINESISKLPPKCKTIFTLSRFEGMKYSEIAEYLNISVKTVENQMGIALKKLRNELKPLHSQGFLTISIGIGLTLLFQLSSVLILIYFIQN